jgi:hypothetical protein
LATGGDTFSHSQIHTQHLFHYFGAFNSEALFESVFSLEKWHRCSVQEAALAAHQHFKSPELLLAAQPLHVRL